MICKIHKWRQRRTTSYRNKTNGTRTQIRPSDLSQQRFCTRLKKIRLSDVIENFAVTYTTNCSKKVQTKINKFKLYIKVYTSFIYFPRLRQMSTDIQQRIKRDVICSSAHVRAYLLFIIRSCSSCRRLHMTHNFYFTHRLFTNISTSVAHTRAHTNISEYVNAKCFTY